MRLYSLGSEAVLVLSQVSVPVETPHRAFLACQPRNVFEVEHQVVRGPIMVHEKHRCPAATQGLVEELPCGNRYIVAVIFECDLRGRLLERAPAMTRIRLVHSDDLFVGHDAPHRIHDIVIVDIHGQRERRGYDGPGAEVAPRLRVAQARIAVSARPMIAAHLQPGYRPSYKPNYTTLLLRITLAKRGPRFGTASNMSG